MPQKEISRSENQGISKKGIRESEYQRGGSPDLIIWYSDILPTDLLVS